MDAHRFGRKRHVHMHARWPAVHALACAQVFNYLDAKHTACFGAADGGNSDAVNKALEELYC